MEMEEISTLNAAIQKWSNESPPETTVRVSRLSAGLQQSLAGAYLDSEMYPDFKVTVEGVDHPCHRFILAISSEFFQALLRSGMQESMSGRAELRDISSRAFATILKLSYTGDLKLIDADNVLDIWQHAHILQFHGVVRECEDFVRVNISCENCFQFYYAARSYHSERSIAPLLVFMRENFEEIAASSQFVRCMTPGMLLCLLGDQHLGIAHEDVAIDAVLRWVKFEPKKDADGGVCAEDLMESLSLNHSNVRLDRTEYLCKLLHSSRLWIASNECLEILFKEYIISSSTESTSIVKQALMYKRNPYLKQVAWPLQATHRHNSQFRHALVVMTKSEIYLHSLGSQGKDSLALPFPARQPGADMISMLVSDNDLYVEAGSAYWSSLQKLEVDKKWKRVIDDDCSYIIADSPSKLISCNGHIYRYLSNSLQLLRISEAWEHNHWIICSKHELDSVDVISTWYDSLLFFKVDRTSTKVYILEVKTDTCSTFSVLEGTSKHIVTFIHQECLYILQGDGNLWHAKKEISGALHFEHIAKLWSESWEIHAAVIFMGALYVCGSTLVPLSNGEKFPGAVPFLDSVRAVLYDNIVACQPIIVDSGLLA